MSVSLELLAEHGCHISHINSLWHGYTSLLEFGRKNYFYKK